MAAAARLHIGAKTRSDLLRELSDRKKAVLVCRLNQWLFSIAAVAVVLAVSGGFLKWAVAAVCATIGSYAWNFGGAGQEKIEKIRRELSDLSQGVSKFPAFHDFALRASQYPLIEAFTGKPGVLCNVPARKHEAALWVGGQALNKPLDNRLGAKPQSWKLTCFGGCAT
jgi:hypothetical protein